MKITYWEDIDFGLIRVGDIVRKKNSTTLLTAKKWWSNGVLIVAKKLDTYTWHGDDPEGYEVQRELEGKKVDFKSLVPGDIFYLTGYDLNTSVKDQVFKVNYLTSSGGLNCCNIESGISYNFGGFGDYYLIPQNVPTFEKEVMGDVVYPARKSKWWILEAAFGCEPHQPKQISDYPHECPYCKSPAYIGGGLNIDCKGKCSRSQ